MLQLNKTELDYLLALVENNPDHPVALYAKLQEEHQHFSQQENADKSQEACSFKIVFNYKSRVGAVKIYRALTGCGLREAHDAVITTNPDGKPVRVEGNANSYMLALKLAEEYSGISIEIG